MKKDSQINLKSYLRINWPVHGTAGPHRVHAYTTLVSGGCSTGDYRSFNLADHVGDDIQAVMANRTKLRADLKLNHEPVWLQQVHGNRVILADKQLASSTAGSVIQADASISTTPEVVCTVLTADCLPVFFCNQSATEVAVAHAGWRGLHAGIISNTINAMQSPADEILVSLGPAIGATAFEVGTEVYDTFVNKNTSNESAFVKTDEQHYLCDIYKLAQIELLAIGVEHIAVGNYCTFSEAQRFYSYRRQNNTGRMANLIWLSE